VCGERVLPHLRVLNVIRMRRVDLDDFLSTHMSMDR
jgi:hypothetical protein